MQGFRSLILLTALLLTLAPIAGAQNAMPGTNRPGAGNPPRVTPGMPPLNGPAGTPAGAGGSTTFTPGSSAQGMTVPQAHSALAAQGFTNVQNLQRNGNTYTGMASHDGRMVPVTIDANTGVVTER